MVREGPTLFTKAGFDRSPVLVTEARDSWFLASLASSFLSVDGVMWCKNAALLPNRQSSAVAYPNSARSAPDLGPRYCSWPMLVATIKAISNKTLNRRDMVIC